MSCDYSFYVEVMYRGLVTNHIRRQLPQTKAGSHLSIGGFPVGQLMSSMENNIWFMCTNKYLVSL